MIPLSDRVKRPEPRSVCHGGEGFVAPSYTSLHVISPTIFRGTPRALNTVRELGYDVG